MPTFDHLPVEVVVHIVSFLYEQEDLGALCLTSRRLGSIAERSFYSDAHLYTDDFDSFLAFVRTIISRPELGNHVRDIRLNWVENEGYKVTRKTRKLTPFTEAATNKGLSASLQAAINRRQCSALTILLLHYLPRLNTLYLDECSGGTARLAEAALGRIDGGVPAGLRSVKEITMTYHDMGKGFKGADVVPFLSLPNINFLYVINFAGEDDGYGAENEDVAGGDMGADHPSQNPFEVKGGSSIASIVFEYSTIDSRLLTRILRVPRALKSLSYSVGEGTSGYPLLYPSVVGEGLRAQKDTLTAVRVVHLDTFPDENALQHTVLGSFHDFIALEGLELHLTMLLGPAPTSLPDDDFLLTRFFALLPPTLVLLGFYLDGNWTPESFATLLGLRRNWSTWKKERLSKVEEFFVVGWPSPGDELIKVYNDAGIKLTVQQTVGFMSPFGLL